MKKFFIITALLASTSAYAHGPGGFGGFHGGGGFGGFHGGGFGGGGFRGFGGVGGFGGVVRPSVVIGGGGWRPGWGWRGAAIGGAVITGISAANNWGRPWGVPWSAIPFGGVPVYAPPPPPVYYAPPPPPPPVYYPPPQAYYPPPPPVYNPGVDVGAIVAGVIQGLQPFLAEFFNALQPSPPQYIPPPPEPQYAPPPRIAPRPPVYTEPRVAPPNTQPRIERPARPPARIEPLPQNGANMNGHTTCTTKSNVNIDVDLAMNIKSKQLTKFEVTVNNMIRSSQYQNIKLHNDKNTLYWEGDRARVHMIGTLSQDGVYTEVVIDNGKREVVTQAKCSEPTYQ